MHANKCWLVIENNINFKLRPYDLLEKLKSRIQVQHIDVNAVEKKKRCHAQKWSKKCASAIESQTKDKMRLENSQSQRALDKSVVVFLTSSSARRSKLITSRVCNRSGRRCVRIFQNDINARLELRITKQKRLPRYGPSRCQTLRGRPAALNNINYYCERHTHINYSHLPWITARPARWITKLTSPMLVTGILPCQAAYFLPKLDQQRFRSNSFYFW